MRNDRLAPSPMMGEGCGGGGRFTTQATPCLTLSLRGGRGPIRLLAVYTVLAIGCAGKPAPQPVAAPAGTAVTVVRPVKKPITRVIEQPGTVEPTEETQLFAKLPGYVQTLGSDGDRRIDIGSRVKLGQELAVIAIPELEKEADQKTALVKQSRAEVVQAKKSLEASSAGVVLSEAMVSEAKAGLGRASALFTRWESESSRIAGLVRSGVIDAQTRDETLNQFRAAEATRAEATAKVASAEAAVLKAKADRDKAIADVTASEARQEVSEAEVARLTELRKYTRVTAPFDGVVTRRAVSTGDFLSGNGKEGIFTVARLDPVRVVVQVPEADAGLVADGLPVRLTVQALGGPELTGTVARTSWSLAAGSRTLRAEVDLPNPDGKVRPGMYAYARITATFPEAWSVPASAVGKAGDDAIVYFAVNGKALRTVVQPLRGDGQFTQLGRYKSAGATDWADFTGMETLATPAATLTDGAAVPTSP